MGNIFSVNKKINVAAVILFMLLPLVIGWLSTLFAPDQGVVYANLEKPGFAPPSWLFAPVWAVLYLLMGLAYYRVWMIGREGYKITLQSFFFFLQLFFNFMWTILFFSWELRGLAFVWIIVLLLLVLMTAALFNNRDKIAAGLLLPYILWILYAAALNYSVWVKN